MTGEKVRDEAAVTIPTLQFNSGGRGEGLYGQVVDALGQAIVDGAMPPGTQIQPDEIAAQFGVSRSVIRESVRTLRALGMLEARPQVGTHVLDVSRWDLLNPQIIRWRGNGREYVQQMREILQLRLGIEGVAARLAAQRIDPDSLTELHQLSKDMRRALLADDQDALYSYDARFHRCLLESSQNRLFARFADTTEAVLLSRGRHARVSPPMSLECADLHVAIPEAIARGDAFEAERIAREVVEIAVVDFDRVAPISLRFASPPP